MQDSEGLLLEGGLGGFQGTGVPWQRLLRHLSLQEIEKTLSEDSLNKIIQRSTRQNVACEENGPCVLSL